MTRNFLFSTPAVDSDLYASTHVSDNTKPDNRKSLRLVDNKPAAVSNHPVQLTLDFGEDAMGTDLNITALRTGEQEVTSC